jgi:hypothetical protein
VEIIYPSTRSYIEDIFPGILADRWLAISRFKISSIWGNGTAWVMLKDSDRIIIDILHTILLHRTKIRHVTPEQMKPKGFQRL